MSLKAITTTATTSLSRHVIQTLLNKPTTLSHLTQIHAQIIHHNFQNDIALSTKLIHKLFDFNATNHAHSLFFTLRKPDLFLFNVLIKGFASNNRPLLAISLFSHLRKSADLQPDNYTYAYVVLAAKAFGCERLGLLVHGMVVVDGFGLDLYVGSGLVDFYFKFGKDIMSKKVFDRLPKRDTVLCNTMISGLARNYFCEDSVRIFQSIVSGIGERFDCISVIAVLPAVAELKDLRLGLEIQCLATKFGFYSHVSVLTGLMSMYSKCGDFEAAKVLFQDIGRIDLISCNAMISGFSLNGKVEAAMGLFREWFGSGNKVIASTIVGLLPFSSPFGHLPLIDCILGFCQKSNIISSASVSTAFVTIYSRLNEMELARQLFNESSEKTLPSWNAIIAGYAQNGLTEAAISLFREMQDTNVSPNPVTATSILSACAQLGALSLGKWVHGLVKSKNFESNIYVSTALIDMYAKCGSIGEARQLFDSMPERNDVSWNAMISGYGLHGHGREALALFYDMLNSNISPTAVTFLSALYACSHAGLVKEGDEIFHSMISKYKFEPTIEHYACMVDVLGRAGKLDEAFEFIKTMPFKPDPSIWGTLLGACLIHKNTNLARVASERLFERDSENMGHYVLMSNIYSSARNYPQAALVRQAAKKKRLMKTPGCTLIEVGQTPHVFVSGDRSHPQSSAIYAELERLTGKIKEAGFQTETAAALHDVEEEEKEMLMNVHSEKLAIAFGLISTEPGTEIRIIKNLRVCLDCHTATKFISKITGRVIVVRDANRFHHFKDGLCSCGDYW